jgi:uncharacterized membrane protein YgdD (TMEM256/DUF423 family)
MNVNPRLLIMIAALSGFLAVALGAFAAHGLKQVLSLASLQIFQTATQYQMYHALALLATALMLKNAPQIKSLKLASLAFILGSLLFCGSLYALALGAPALLGIITPLGGISFLVGWLMLAISAKHF